MLDEKGFIAPAIMGGYEPNTRAVYMIDGFEQIRTAENISNMIRNYDRDRAEMRLKVSNLETFLREKSDEIDEDILEGICNIFDLELSKEVEVTIQVTVTARIEVPLSEQTDFYIGEHLIDLTLESIGDYDILDSDVCVDSIDYEIS